MKMLKRFIVKKNERGLLYSEGDFLAVLEPGTYRRFDPYDRLSLESFSLNTSQFEHRLAGYLRQSEPQLVERYFTRMDLGDNEAGLRYEDGVLVELLAPGSRRLYWKGQTEQRLERIDLTQDYRLSAALVAQLHQPNLRDRALAGLDAVLLVQVPAFQVGVLKVDGALAGLLQAGQYGFWRYNRQVSVELVDTRIQALEVSGQEILTRDKVSLRLNLAANWRYSDVLTAFSRLSKPLEYLYRELQFGLRAAVGTRTLDELLENKQSIDEAVSAHLAAKLEDSGLEVSGLGVRDIILPGEMKTSAGAGGGGGEGGPGQCDPPPRGNLGDPLAAEYREGHGGKPDRAASEGTGNPGAGGRAHRPDFGIRWPGPGIERTGHAEAGLITNDSRAVDKTARSTRKAR